MARLSQQWPRRSVFPMLKHDHLSIVYLWIVCRESFRCERTSALQHLFPYKEKETHQKCFLDGQLALGGSAFALGIANNRSFGKVSTSM